jgi:hypothetical protein
MAAISRDERSPNHQVAGTRDRIARSARSARLDLFFLWANSISDDPQLRSPSVAPSLRAKTRAEIASAMRGKACGPELQPKFQPVVKPEGPGYRPVIGGASHRRSVPHGDTFPTQRRLQQRKYLICTCFLQRENLTSNRNWQLSAVKIAAPPRSKMLGLYFFDPPPAPNNSPPWSSWQWVLRLKCR